jgi:hypothetical protein
MDKDEIDRLVKKPKKKTEEGTDDDVDMSDPRSSQPASGEKSRRTRPTPEPAAAYRASPRSSKKRRTNVPPEKKKRSVEKPKRNSRSGRHGEFRDQLFTVSISLKMKTRLTPPQGSSIQ